MKLNLDHSRGAAALYVQLADALQDFITAQGLKPGDVLPGETVLATDNRLSRTTVAKAFDLLMERGRVTRRQGRGTFVSAPPMERVLPELNSFSDHVRGLGMRPGSSLVSFEFVPAGASGAPVTPFDPATDLVVFERVRTVGDAPVGIQRTIVPCSVAESIGLTESTAAQEDFSFYEALRANGIVLNTGDETLRAINADPSEAELLGVDPGTALVEIVRQSIDASGRLIEVVRARYLGSQYIYHISFAPSVTGGPYVPSPLEKNARPTGGGFLRHAGSVR